MGLRVVPLWVLVFLLRSLPDNADDVEASQSMLQALFPA